MYENILQCPNILTRARVVGQGGKITADRKPSKKSKERPASCYEPRPTT